MLVKGLTLLGSVICGGAALAAAPVVTVSAPLWGIMGKKICVNALSAAGVAAAAATGAGVGKIAGQTGGSLVIQGLDSASQSLLSKIMNKSGQ